jgi:GNAT superfamily N-acetyltransferase
VSDASQVWLAGPDDAAAVSSLLGEFRDWWGYTAPTDDALAASVRRLLADPLTEFLLATGEGGGPAVGVCQVRYRHSVWTGSDDSWLEDLFVSDAARQAGVATALVEVVIARARDRGCVRVLLDVNEANPPAIALYERFGFSAWFDPPGGRNLNMRLRLD